MALGEILNTDWVDCRVNFDIIEQVVLARNEQAHGGQLSSFHVLHNSNSLRKHRHPFFVNERELRFWKELGGSESSLFRPGIEVGRRRSWPRSVRSKNWPIGSDLDSTGLRSGGGAARSLHTSPKSKGLTPSPASGSRRCSARQANVAALSWNGR